MGGRFHGTWPADSDSVVILTVVQHCHPRRKCNTIMSCISTRSDATVPSRSGQYAAGDLFTESADHVAVRKVLCGVKDRAEGRVEPFARQTVEFAVLVWAFVASVVAIWCVLRYPVTRRGWLTGLTTGLVWLIVWYAPIPLGVSVALNVLIFWLMRGAGGERDHFGPTHAPSPRAPATVRGVP